MNRIARGAAAGGVATAAMTAAILAGQRLLPFRTPPPRQITRTTLRRLGGGRIEREAPMPVLWVASHEAYGMGCGVVYAVARPLLPGSPLAAGLLFGEVVWAIGYLGYLPALGLYPSPNEDRRSRTLVMIVAHTVFGVVLADVEHRLARRERPVSGGRRIDPAAGLRSAGDAA